MRVEQTGTIIDVYHDDFNVHVKARGIKNASNLNGEVEIFYSVDFNEGQVQVKHRTKLYFFSDKGKDDLAKILADKTNSDRPWGSIIDDISNAIIDKHREGNEEIVMSKVDDYSFRSYQLKPFLREGVPNLMWASGGSGKSYFATLTAVLVSRGIGTLGMTPRQTNVLYLDWEEDEDIMRNRIYSLQKGLGLEEPEQSGIIWKKMVGALDTSIEELSSLVSKHNIGYVIIDSLNPALGGKSIDSESVESFFFALRALNVTSLLIDHANKAGERSGKFEIYGSAFKYARARNVYEISKVQNNESDNIEVVFYHRKANDSKFQSLKGFTITFTEKDVWNGSEGEYETMVDKVVFEQTALPDMDGKLLQKGGVLQLAEEIVRAVEPDPTNGTKEIHIEELKTRVSTLKEEEVSAPALKNMIGNSSVLLTDGDMVLLKATAMRPMEDIDVEF